MATLQDIDVTFRYNLKVPELVSCVKNMKKKSLVVVWYVGINGLKEDGVKYYQKMFKEILASNNDVNIMLYDISAWKALFDINYSIHNDNTILDDVKNMTSSKFLSHKSKNYFDWLLQNKDNVEYLLNEEKLYTASEKYQPSNIRFSDIKDFAELSSSAIYTLDTGKSYSCLQYIEMLYLVKEFVGKGYEEILFALPNNELKYYDIPGLDFVHNLKQILDKNSKITLTLCSFIFGKHSYHRPYNMGNRVLEKITKERLM